MTQSPSYLKRDHGGGLDAAMREFGGPRSQWLDLSTGINPIPYPMPELDSDVLTQLPDVHLFDNLADAARQFWDIPEGFGVIPASGASAFISLLPRILSGSKFRVPHPTYNEHRASFEASGWTYCDNTPDVDIHVHPNNPDGTFAPSKSDAAWRIIDESFCDICPEKSFVPSISDTNIVLKSFGKFWGLAGLRLGFLIAQPSLTIKIQEALGPWAVSGPSLAVGAKALLDFNWATETRARLKTDTQALNSFMTAHGANVIGGTDLFQLYAVDNAQAWQDRLASHQIWTRIFPYSENYIRLGIPSAEQLIRLKAAFNER